ncbi:hypothetical protein F7215_04560 [Helicobacter pylori]|nr:hypothetical protein [Helicobacter pylori]
MGRNYSKFWLFCQALSHSYNKVATNGLQARLKLELVSAKKAFGVKNKNPFKTTTLFHLFFAQILQNPQKHFF